ncbi:MAG: hypothetical protein FJW85_08805 [Actinobacteria bacterium]|nr:hypothetical protein [Actinomycetota bacterium]
MASAMTITTAPATRKGMPMKKRLVLAAVIITLTIVPALIMVAVTYIVTGEVQAAATWASIPAIAGIAAEATAGRRFAVVAAIATAMIAPVCIVAGASPVSGAGLMGIMAITIGQLSKFGLHKSALLYPVMMSWAVIDPPAWAGQTTVDRFDESYLLWMSLIFFVGAFIPALVLPFLMRKRPRPPRKPYSRDDALPYTVMITVLVTVSTFVVLSNPKWYGGGFIIAVILIMAPIGDTQTLKPTIMRILGTVVGSVLLVVVLSQVDSLTVIYLVGLVFIVIALIARFGTHVWIYYVFMVPATAALNATTFSQVGQLGEQRLGDNIIGGILVIIGSAIAVSYSHWAQRHGRAHDDDPETHGLQETPVPAASSA